MEQQMEINRQIAAKVLETVDAGLCSGVGIPVPGQMCVEAAVCYALGQEHGDEPVCVSRALRVFKIGLNDSQWSSNATRAKGMRRLALVQLGTAGTLDDVEFSKQLAEMAIRVVVPIALRATGIATLEAYALRCEQEGTEEAASYAASAASYAASAAGAARAASYAAGAARAASDAARAARAASDAAGAASYAAGAASYAARAARAAGDAVLSKVAEAVVQILIGLGAAGAQWLSLTDGTEINNETR